MPTAGLDPQVRDRQGPTSAATKFTLVPAGKALTHQPIRTGTRDKDTGHDMIKPLEENTGKIFSDINHTSGYWSGSQGNRNKNKNKQRGPHQTYNLLYHKAEETINKMCRDPASAGSGGTLRMNGVGERERSQVGPALIGPSLRGRE